MPQYQKKFKVLVITMSIGLSRKEIDCSYAKYQIEPSECLKETGRALSPKVENKHP